MSLLTSSSGSSKLLDTRRLGYSGRLSSSS